MTREYEWVKNYSNIGWCKNRFTNIFKNTVCYFKNDIYHRVLIVTDLTDNLHLTKELEKIVPIYNILNLIKLEIICSQNIWESYLKSVQKSEIQFVVRKPKQRNKKITFLVISWCCCVNKKLGIQWDRFERVKLRS